MRGRCARSLREIEEQYVSSFTAAPEVIVLDIDSTDDPTHGQQQLSFFHGYYDQHMYHPLLIFDGESGQLVSAVLRPGNAHAARGAMGVLRRIIRRLKQRFPHVQIVVRGDSAFAVPRLLRMLEELERELGRDRLRLWAGAECRAAPLRGGSVERKPAHAFEPPNRPCNTSTPLPMRRRAGRRSATWS